jgi:hypothetical protein
MAALTATALWLEITIAGFMYLVAICFFALAGFRFTDFQKVLGLKEILPYLSVGVVASSYVIGMISHRITQALKWAVVKWWHKRSKKPRVPDDIKFFTSKMVPIWQSASDRLLKEIDLQYGLVSLLGSLTWSTPLVALSIVAWLLSVRRHGIWMVAAFAIGFWVCCFVAYRRQARQCVELREQAGAVVASFKKLSTGMSAGGAG